MSKEHDMVAIELHGGGRASVRRSSVGLISTVQHEDDRWLVVAGGHALHVGPVGLDQLARAGLIPPNPNSAKPDDAELWQVRLLKAIEAMPAVSASGDGWTYDSRTGEMMSTRIPLFFNCYGCVMLGGASTPMLLLNTHGWKVSGPIRDEADRLLLAMERAAQDHNESKRAGEEARLALAVADAERTLLGAE